MTRPDPRCGQEEEEDNDTPDEIEKPGEDGRDQAAGASKQREHRPILASPWGRGRSSAGSGGGGAPSGDEGTLERPARGLDEGEKRLEGRRRRATGGGAGEGGGRLPGGRPRATGDVAVEDGDRLLVRPDGHERGRGHAQRADVVEEPT